MTAPVATRPQPVSSAFAFLRMGRPLFLIGGVAFHLLGLSMALLVTHRFDPMGAILLQVVITFTQWMTHYANEYFDRDGDALNTSPTAWSGGSRVLPEGLLAPRVALIAAAACAGIASVGMLAMTLAARPGPLALPMMIAGLLAGWFYSAPPVRLVGRGLGEGVGALVIPGLTATLGYYVQAAAIEPVVIALILPLIPMQFAMLLAVAAPDVEADAASGKRTLVVWLGRKRAATLYALAMALAHAPLIAYALIIPTLLPTLLMLPLAVWHGWAALRGGWREPSRWGMTAFWSIAIMIGAALLEAGALARLALTGYPQL